MELQCGGAKVPSLPGTESTGAKISLGAAGALLASAGVSLQNEHMFSRAAPSFALPS